MLFRSGGITWEILNKIPTSGIPFNGEINFTGDVESNSNKFYPEDSTNISLKITSATDMQLNGKTKVKGSLVQDSEDNVVVINEHLNSIRRSEDQEVVSSGIKVGKNTLITDTDYDNTVGIRGDKDSDPNTGGIVFGEWGTTGIKGGKNNLELYANDGGSIYSSNLVDLGQKDKPFNKIYVKDIVATSISNEIIEAIYPVGSVYLSVNSTNPAILFGGDWEEIDGELMLLTDNASLNGLKLHIWKRIL